MWGERATSFKAEDISACSRARTQKQCLLLCVCASHAKRTRITYIRQCGCTACAGGAACHVSQSGSAQGNNVGGAAADAAQGEGGDILNNIARTLLQRLQLRVDLRLVLLNVPALGAWVCGVWA